MASLAALLSIGPLACRGEEAKPARPVMKYATVLYDDPTSLPDETHEWLLICTIVQMKWSCQQRSALAGSRRQRPKSIILKGSGCSLLPMPTSARHIVTMLTVALAGCGLTGCGTINEKIAAGVSDASRRRSAECPRTRRRVPGPRNMMNICGSASESACCRRPNGARKPSPRPQSRIRLARTTGISVNAFFCTRTGTHPRIKSEGMLRSKTLR